MRGQPKIFTGFVDGVNLRDAPYLLGDTEARDARNVQATVRGAIRKRDGAIGFATPAAALTSLFAAQDPTFLLGAGGTKIYAINPAAVVTDITGALSLAAGALFEWVQAPASGGQGPLYGMNGSQAVQWTGAGNAVAWTAASGTLPIAKYLEYAGNRVWAANIPAAATPDPGSTVAYSDLGDPRAWPAANITEFDPGDGEDISGIGRIGPYVLVFKPSKCWVIYDLDTSANRPLAENVGCVAHRSIVETDQGTFFLSRDQGPFVTNGSGVKRLNDKLQPTFTQLLQANRQQAAAAFFAGHYYLAISQAGATNTILLDYDVQLESWWLHTLPVAQLAVWEPAGIPQLHAAVAGIARVDQLFIPGRTVDAGDVVFSAFWLGPHHVFGAPHRRKRGRELRFDGKGRIEVSVARDFATAPTLEGSADFTSSEGLFGIDDGGLFGIDDGSIYVGAAAVGEQAVLNLGVARAWSVQFGIADANKFEVEAYTFLLGDRRD